MSPTTDPTRNDRSPSRAPTLTAESLRSLDELARELRVLFGEPRPAMFQRLARRLASRPFDLAEPGRSALDN